RASHTLLPTALVHEAWVRLAGSSELEVGSQDHFFLLASRTMRRILIDHARGVSRIKRGGGRGRVSLTIADPESSEALDPAELIALDEALGRLRELDERKARVVELRFFGGLDEETTARVLGIARSTASSDWRFARAWLQRMIDGGAGNA
ncbi:MAG: ECF-type sigma factor, partial [Phycisphaerales bacterium]